MAIFDSMKMLTTPVPKGNDPSSAPGSSAGQKLDDSLRNTISAVNKSLQADTTTRTHLSEEVRAELTSLTSDPGSGVTRWQHVRCCLLLVRTLHSHLTRELEAFRESQQKSEIHAGRTPKTKPKESDAPPLSPDTISIGHQKVLTTTLQFVVTMGICPYLSPGVGVPVQLRSGFSRVLSVRPPKVSEGDLTARLYEVVSTLLGCVTVPSLGGVILTRHLGDLMSSLLQILHEPRDGVGASGERSAHPDNGESRQFKSRTAGLYNAEQTNFCQEQLTMLLERAYQPAVMRELLVLQGGPGRPKGAPGRNPLPRAPGWLREVCASLLMERVMKRRGLQHLLRAVLDVSGETGNPKTKVSTLDWQRCDAVARILTDYRSTSITEEEYFRAIYPQIVELLDYDDQLILQQVLRVCCTAIGGLLERRPTLTQKHLIDPLQAPLLKTLVTSAVLDDIGDAAVTIATEDDLTRCLENLCKVYLEGNEPSSVVMETIHPLLQPLFCMYSSMKDSMWVMRPMVERLLLASLQSCDHSTAVELLASATGVRGHEKHPSMHQGVEFVLGESGGVVAVRHPPKSSDEQFTDSVFQGEQNAVCCTELLQAGKGKLDRLAADFFLLVLKELTAVLDNPTGESGKSPSRPEELLLEVESRQLKGISQVEHSLRILSMVSSLCEGLGPTVLQSLDHMIAFAHATLERACKHLGRETDSAGGFEAETVMFACGLLSAIIGGVTEKKVTRANRQSLSSLLPLLEKISQEHPSETLREMSENLRIAIATHGAVQAEGSLGNPKSFRKQDMMSQRDRSTKEQIQDLGSADDRSKETSNRLSKSSGAEGQSEEYQKSVGGTKDTISGRVCNGNVNSTGGNSVYSSSRAGGDGECTMAGGKDSNGSDEERGTRTEIEKGEIASTNTDHQEGSNNVVHHHHHVVTDKPTRQEVAIKDDPSTQKSSDVRKSAVDREEEQGCGVQSDAFDKAYEELFDPLVPVRGHALIALSRLLQEKDPKALQKQETLLILFLEHLGNEDSYVYLTAVGALVSLADRFPGKVIPTLCAEYSSDDQMGSGEGRRSKVRRSAETRLKVGEALVKATRLLGDLAPHYSRLLLNAFLSGVRDEDGDVRASSLSNLGEVCQLLRFSLAGSVSEIFHCLSSVLQSDPEVTVRRACVLVISLLLRGLGADALQVMEDKMRDLYRLLKLLHSREKDDIMLLHVQLALEELDVLMRKYLFPEQTLSKKITVLP